MTGNGERKISSLRDLPRDITPPRDLWQGIASESAARPAQDAASVRRFGRTARMRVFAAAAMIAMLAVGIWIGRAVLPMGGNTGTTNGTSITASNHTATPAAGVFPAAFVMDPKYTRERAELVKDLEARLQALPPDSRDKVISSLKAINDSKQQLEHELGKDPSNALLQELLVNTYQDEMRLLTTVHEAGRSGEGI
jgi:hypothetical protein